MEVPISSRLKNAWNVFLNRDPTKTPVPYGSGYSYRPDQPRLTRGNDRSIITSIINRIGIDATTMEFVHCKVDADGQFVEKIDSELNKRLTVEANIDQTGRAFLLDVAMSMMDDGAVAVVPVDTSDNPDDTTGFKILTLRTGRIVEWKPYDVRVRLYNDRTGEKEEVWVPKASTAIVENPMYSIMNAPNSTMQRLKRKLALLDVTDEQTASGKLDLIIQLPYVVKSDLRKKQANERRKEIEDQLTGSKYGIAYIDGTEHITQLNRAVENNLLSQIEYLTKQLFAQLGLTEEILNGSANEQTMINYYTRTVEPITCAITEEFRRKFLSQTARSQGQSIVAFRDPFKLAPINTIAELADKFSRNEIMTSNEIRKKLGMRPADDQKADMLVNANLNQSSEEIATHNPVTPDTETE